MPKHKKIHRGRANNVYRLRKKDSSPRLAFKSVLSIILLTIVSVFAFDILTKNTESSVAVRTDLSAGYSYDPQIAEPDGVEKSAFEAESSEETVVADQGNEQELPTPEAPLEPELTRMTGTVKSGDTPTTLLEGHLDLAEIQELCSESKNTYALSKLKAGQPWTMIYSANELVGLEYEIDQNERLVVSMTDNGYEFRREPIPYELERKTVHGTIEQSLFGAVQQAGESDDLALKLAEVFAWDIDFVRDLRTGDSFKAVIEKRFRNGKPCGYGKLLAASFTNQGETYYAFRYKSKNGDTAYYDQSGRPLRKAFLKAPVPFTRISSGYSMSRMHPILHYARPHQGIDYSAPAGTPISTVSDGVIAEASYNGSQGKFVRVVHSNGYETIYNHMSRFASTTQKGTRIKQGAVIGYVGMTGYATGPHLDFRMKQNGTLINPLQLKSIPADPIAARELPIFSTVVAELKKELLNPHSAGMSQTATLLR